MSTAPDVDLATLFESDRARYCGFAEALKTLVSDLVTGEISTVSIGARCKGVENLRKKVAKKAGKYTDLGQITDLVGARIITLYEDDVNRAGLLVEDAFEIDWGNSADKRASHDQDRFGYLSFHYVVQLSAAQLARLGDERYRGMRAEIQVRSILQHAWAEIEHDLGYKPERELPRHIRRRFSRLASLLELADAEFAALRNELGTYNRDAAFLVQPNEFQFDEVAIAAFARSDPAVRFADQRIAGIAKCSLADPCYSPGQYSALVKHLVQLGVTSLSQLEKCLDRVGPRLASFYTEYRNQRGAAISKPLVTASGASLFWLATYLATERGDRAKLLSVISDSTNQTDAETRADACFTAYRGVAPPGEVQGGAPVEARGPR